MCEARKRLRTWVEGIACAPAVTGHVLLDAATASMASAKRCSLGAASMRAVPTRE